jgi:hypothetical protein
MAERFVKVPVGMTGKPTPMAVYYVLAEHRNSKTGRCNVTDQRVADRLELSVSTVARARIKLSDAGWLDWMPESQRPPGEIVTGHVSGEMATGQRNVRARPRNPQHDASSAAVEGQRRPPRQMVR